MLPGAPRSGLRCAFIYCWLCSEPCPVVLRVAKAPAAVALTLGVAEPPSPWVALIHNSWGTWFVT
eukprot:4895746-Lingulodinium_polyedra.AAC.1